MSAGAIILMCIACVGLWGGAGVFLGIMLKSRDAKEEEQRYNQE